MDERERMDEVGRIPPYARGRYWTDRCFVCGKENVAGLGARFVAGAGRAQAEVQFPPRLQGLLGVTHGGAVSALLDESIWYAFFSLGLLTMTAELKIRFRKPVTTGESVRVEASVTEEKGRRLSGEALLYGAEGKRLAQATGMFLAVPHLTRHLDALDFHAEAVERASPLRGG